MLVLPSILQVQCGHGGVAGTDWELTGTDRCRQVLGRWKGPTCGQRAPERFQESIMCVRHQAAVSWLCYNELTCFSEVQIARVFKLTKKVGRTSKM
ncbi:Protein of unknown function [Gryllus bimaculatus]|nr:Protein of unknown function [Gryllus bimaculatus]